MKLTKHIFRWHHWCGLIVGVFLLMMSLTGSVLAFSEELEALEETPVITPRAGVPSFDASFEKVQQKYPGWEIRLYHLPEAGKALVYELRQKEKSKKVYVHPVSGEVVGINENANNSLQRRLLLLHYTLFSGTPGKIIVFFVGVCFLITLLTGLIVYRKAIFKVFSFKVSWNRKTSRAAYSSLHRIVGVWSVFFNLLIVATGLWLSGQIALTAIKAAPAKTKQAAYERIRSIDAVVNTVYKTSPDFEIHLVRIRPGGNTVQVSGRLKTDPAYYGNYYSSFSIDGSNGAILSSQFMKDLPFHQRLAKMAGPLHFGNYGGLAVKILYSLLGLMPALLSLTGFVLWCKRRKRK